MVQGVACGQRRIPGRASRPGGALQRLLAAALRVPPAAGSIVARRGGPGARFPGAYLAREDLAGVGPEKGRFRTFLLTSLRNFLVKQALHDKALKRGGGRAAISIDGKEAERLCGPDLAADSPETAFDRHFAQAVVTRAFAALRDEHRARGREPLFATLAPLLDGVEPEGYEAIAAQLGMTPGALAVAVHRMRGRLRELLRAEIRQLCASPVEEEQEMRHLLEAWSR